MSTADASAAALLAELTGRGIELKARGERLRYRPRSALTPELAERVKAHKPALLALLQQDRPPETPLSGRDRAASGRTSPTSGGDRPEAPARQDSCDVPHELSLAERAETGFINPGWRPQDWACRLRQLAERCETVHPELAATYRAWAANVLRN